MSSIMTFTHRSYRFGTSWIRYSNVGSICYRSRQGDHNYSVPCGKMAQMMCCNKVVRWWSSSFCKRKIKEILMIRGLVIISKTNVAGPVPQDPNKSNDCTAEHSCACFLLSLHAMEDLRENRLCPVFRRILNRHKGWNIHRDITQYEDTHDRMGDHKACMYNYIYTIF